MPTVQAPTRTYLAGSDVKADRRVKIKAGSTSDPLEVEHCTASDQGFGYVQFDAAAGETVTVRFDNAQGTQQAVASGAISAGAQLFAAAAGRVAAAGTVALGYHAEEAAAELDDVIEVTKS